ncbi:MAG TPA: cytochrome c [Gammaproteobacteria bacterium]|nr:cytochrome c [Gammaproteobacteria bacterium]
MKSSWIVVLLFILHTPLFAANASNGAQTGDTNASATQPNNTNVSEEAQKNSVEEPNPSTNTSAESTNGTQGEIETTQSSQTHAQGFDKASTCVACHGPDGNSVVPMWPKIAGQHLPYLVKQLKDYRLGENGPRFDPQMYSMVMQLTDEDILQLAQYYAGLKQTPGKALADYLELGQRIYRGGLLEKGISACTACHGPNGMGNDLAGFPRLSGQHAAYTESQLKRFKDGQRKNDKNSIMRDIAVRMSDEEMKAVSEYIAGLH